MLPRRKVEAEICWPVSSNCSELSWITARSVHFSALVLERPGKLSCSYLRDAQKKHAEDLGVTSRGSGLGCWAETSPHMWDVHPDSDAREMLFRRQACSGDSLFRIWTWQSTSHAWACWVSFMKCTICLMELHIIQGLRQFIKFCRQEPPQMNYSGLKAAQRCGFKLLFLFVLATTVHEINYQDFKEQNVVITQKNRSKPNEIDVEIISQMWILVLQINKEN